MTFTVGDLLARPALETRSLTPGVGERRPVEWAHVCELAEPWRWIGDGALVMTTGLAVPAAAEAQCAYLEGMQRAGIAAVTIGERMSAPPLTPEMLARAAELDFPVLETAHATPFITLAMAVAEENSRANHQRVRATERLYGALRAHAGDGEVDGLLGELGALLGGALSVEPPAPGRGGPHGQIDRLGPGRYDTRLLAPGERRLRFDFAGDAAPDFSLLQHAAAIVSSVLAVRAAAHRREWLHGSLLLGDLLDGSIAPESAARLLEPHELTRPYAIAAWRGDAVTIERAHAALELRDERALLTTKDGLVVVLAAAPSDFAGALEPVTAAGGAVGLSRPFERIAELPEAYRQARLALARGGRASGVIAFDDTRPTSSFLPDDLDRLRDATARTLGPLLAYDRERGSELVPTLRVFLEENRSWVRAAQRLYVHRQTLVARIARIEQLTGMHVNTIEGAAEFWYAIQAGVESGDLPASL